MQRLKILILRFLCLNFFLLWINLLQFHAVFALLVELNNLEQFGFDLLLRGIAPSAISRSYHNKTSQTPKSCRRLFFVKFCPVLRKQSRRAGIYNKCARPQKNYNLPRSLIMPRLFTFCSFQNCTAKSQITDQRQLIPMFFSIVQYFAN